MLLSEREVQQTSGHLYTVTQTQKTVGLKSQSESTPFWEGNILGLEEVPVSCFFPRGTWKKLPVKTFPWLSLLTQNLQSAWFSLRWEASRGSSPKQEKTEYVPATFPIQYSPSFISVSTHPKILRKLRKTHRIKDEYEQTKQTYPFVLRTVGSGIRLFSRE